MSRPRQRVCLEEGLSLDINRLIKKAWIIPGAFSHCRVNWSWGYTQEWVASADLSAAMISLERSWLMIKTGDVDQRVALTTRPRHFGGHQWYFVCPQMNQLASVIWKPPGARSFACRQAWGSQVAYRSQFQSRYDRALSAAQSIHSQLGGPEWAGLDGNDPPKPKWMRRATYQRLLEQSWANEDIAYEKLVKLTARLMGRG